MGVCKIEGCEKEAYTEVCSMHYARMRRRGSYDDPLKDLDRKFWNYVEKDNHNGCWIWMGSKRRRGYGRLRFEGKTVAAHRLSYKMAIGEDPGDKLVCHSCDVPSCVNPDHLFLGTYLDNNRDCVSKNRHRNSKKTHCYKGHPLSGENLIISAMKRECRICVNKRNIESYHRRRKLASAV